MHGVDCIQRHPTSRSSGHRVPDLCDHPRSSTLGLLLLLLSSVLPNMPHLSPAHHEISKHGSPNETRIKVKLTKCPEFKFKPHQVKDSSQSNQGTDHLVSHGYVHTLVQKRILCPRVGGNREKWRAVHGYGCPAVYHLQTDSIKSVVAPLYAYIRILMVEFTHTTLLL
jgi:hypothetical protein